MKKVIYSITKLGKIENTKVTGVGYITDEDLITANVSKTGKPYIRIFSCVKNCHPVMNSTDEFKGAYYEIVEYNERDIEVNYYIWFKLAKYTDTPISMRMQQAILPFARYYPVRSFHRISRNLFLCFPFSIPPKEICLFRARGGGA